MVVAVGLRRHTADELRGGLEGVHADNAGDERGANDLALAGAFAFKESRKNTEGSVDAAQEVGNRHTDPLEVVRARTRDRHEPRLALGDLVVAGTTALGTVVAEAGDRQDHQARVELQAALRGEAQAVHNAGAEVLDDHVCALDELFENVLAVLALEIQRDGFLVAVARQEVRGLLLVFRPHVLRAPAARVVTAGGVFYFDDPRAEVAEDLACVRAGESAGEVYDGVAVEWSLRHVSPSWCGGRRRRCWRLVSDAAGVDAADEDCPRADAVELVHECVLVG